MANRFLSELPAIQATGIDFNTVTAEIQRIISENPKWQSKWDSFYTGEAGTLLTEFMAFIADNLAIKIDAMINEIFVSTAIRDIDKIRLLKLINYIPKYAIAAKIPIVIETNGLSNNKLVVVPAYSFNTALVDRVNSLRFLNIRDVYNNTIRVEFLKYNLDGKPDYVGEYALPELNNSISYTQTFDGMNLEMVEGTTKYIEFSSDTSDGPFFDIRDYNLAANSIQIYETDTLNKYLEVKSFIQFEAFDEESPIPYRVFLNEDGTTRIEFAKDEILTSIKRRFIAGKRIGVFYRTCTGANGNVPIRYVNTNLALTDYISNTRLPAIVYNNNVGYGGMDAETYDEAVINGPLSIRTMDRAVTPQDYNIILNNQTVFDIIQSKSYSATNQPENFKQVYGRWLNPQEVISFVITNKNYSLISPSQYNYFPWIYLKEQNIFNEQYVFDEANYNVEVMMSEIVPELVIRQANTQNQLFRNAIVLGINSQFETGIQSGVDANGNTVYNPNLMLKLHKEVQNNIKYFGQIPFDAIYDSDTQIALETELRTKGDLDNNPLTPDTEGNIITNEVPANYISFNGFNIVGTMSSVRPDPDNPGQDINFTFNQIAPIDIRYYDKIQFVLDDRGIIEVNLKAENTLQGWHESPWSNGSYYIYLNNFPNPYKAPIWSGTTLDAQYRKGIVQLINEHMITLTESVPGEYNFYDAYQDNKSYQYLNVGATDSLASLPFFQNEISNGGTSQGHYGSPEGYKATVIINNEFYRFTFRHDIFEAAYTWFRDSNQSDDIRYNLLTQSQMYAQAHNTGVMEYSAFGIAMVMDYELYEPVKNNQLSQYLEKWDYETAVWIKIQGLKGVRCDCVEIRLFSTDYEALINNQIGLAENTNENYLKWDICFYTYDVDGLMVNTNYIEVKDHDENSGNYGPHLIRNLKGLTIQDNLQLPKVLVAADYNGVASVYEKTDVISGQLLVSQYLQITSPTVGEQSSIYFIRTSNTYDFMNYYCNLKYDNRLTADDINSYYSDKAYGIQRVTLLLENSVNSRYGNGEVYPNAIMTGNLIYEHNNINNNVDMPTIFASYKINTRNEVLIGSVYNNFVYTGNASTDVQYKPPIVGYNGQYIEETDDPTHPYRIDENKSNFDIKFTNNPVNNNSIGLINSDLEVYEVQNVLLETKTITRWNPANLPKLIFTIDDYIDHKIEVDLSQIIDPETNAAITVSNSNQIYNAIIRAYESFMNNVDDYYDLYANKESLIYRSSSDKNVLVLSNLLKRESGNITFYFDDVHNSNADTDRLFKMLFGTDETNPEFYELYDDITLIPPINRAINVDTGIPGDSPLGTVFVPRQDHPLKFTYRLKNNEGVVQGADYYFSVEDYVQQNGSIRQQIVLHKTRNSRFQDLPFYVHFVNNRNYETDQYGDRVETEEDRFQYNMNKYKISGMDVTFAIPYFKTFDIKANIIYNRNYSYDEISERIREVLDVNYDIKNMIISKTISKSRIYKDIMSVIGVTSCEITYFGFDLLNTNEPTRDTLPCNFYEVLCLHEDSYLNGNQNHGKALTISPEEEEY